MTIFAVLLPTPQPTLVAEIVRIFEGNYIQLSETQYLVSSSGTAIEICAKLGIYDAKQPEKVSTGVAVVLATSSYFGRGPTTLWEWMKAKLESPPSG